MDVFIGALRGAICVSDDQKELIDKAVPALFTALLEKNHLTEQDLAFIMFTQTGDLKSRNPAYSLRHAGYCSTVPLFGMQEMEIEGMLEKVIRIMIVTNKKIESPVHVYMDGAEKLRPDLKIE